MEKTVKILLVEDDKNLGFILKSYLVVKGYPTVLSHDGLEALNRFEKEAFDLLVDILMDAGELDKRVPFDKFIDTSFAEKSVTEIK